MLCIDLKENQVIYNEIMDRDGHTYRNAFDTIIHTPFCHISLKHSALSFSHLCIEP